MEWTDDPDRCRKAGVTKDRLVFKTKDEIALEMVKDAREKGIRFGWVGADAGYGKGLSFMKELNAMGETFMIDVHSDSYLFLEQPHPYLPPKAPDSLCLAPTGYVEDEKPVRLDTWVKRQPNSAWKK
jgi:SRSO17 transposase